MMYWFGRIAGTGSVYRALLLPFNPDENLWRFISGPLTRNSYLVNTH
jgi:hypothetical protein